MVSECCGAPLLTNTDIHDGIAMCDSCKEWSAFYEEEDINWSLAGEDYDSAISIHYDDPGDEDVTSE